MEDKQSEVILIGIWRSSYCQRIELALKLKGIPHKYVEEDLSNKSELLLHHNSIHKKVPVLIHNGKPIAESLVILEYIDEHWNNSPKLFPDDPYLRAKLRFWANFYDQKIMVAILPIIMSKGKQREKAIEEMNELLRVFIEGIMKDFPEKFPFDGQNLGLLEVIAGTNLCNYKAFNEAVAVAWSPEKTPPELLTWVNALNQHSLIKQTIPPHHKLVAAIMEKFSRFLKHDA
ncbi:hypothetical protein CsatB_018839 [Cannabis sativa]|uniref:Glutathione S-transferase n=3 Tax=Cannabis sativa TaxID=3483 RepID=A0A7J6FWU2_CANSA|nr:hypothetical protein F8388_000990 [Cannabis sativa]KAF4391837.1 hypothetical protein G4B88_011480 [Cannabis sativa]